MAEQRESQLVHVPCKAIAVNTGLVQQRGRQASPFIRPPGPCPESLLTVSQICSFTHLPSISTFFILKSMLQARAAIAGKRFSQCSSAKRGWRRCCRQHDHVACIAALPTRWL